jgi:hypothetical protein
LFAQFCWTHWITVCLTLCKRTKKSCGPQQKGSQPRPLPQAPAAHYHRHRPPTTTGTGRPPAVLCEIQSVVPIHIIYMYHHAPPAEGEKEKEGVLGVPPVGVGLYAASPRRGRGPSALCGLSAAIPHAAARSSTSGRLRVGPLNHPPKPPCTAGASPSSLERNPPAAYPATPQQVGTQPPSSLERNPPAVLERTPPRPALPCPRSIGTRPPLKLYRHAPAVLPRIPPRLPLHPRPG